MSDNPVNIAKSSVQAEYGAIRRLIAAHPVSSVLAAFGLGAVIVMLVALTI